MMGHMPWSKSLTMRDSAGTQIQDLYDHKSAAFNKGNPNINNTNLSRMHHWLCICLGILLPWFVHKHGCATPAAPNTVLVSVD